jgi:hypothetical protein
VVVAVAGATVVAAAVVGRRHRRGDSPSSRAGTVAAPVTIPFGAADVPEVGPPPEATAESTPPADVPEVAPLPEPTAQRPPPADATTPVHASAAPPTPGTQAVPVVAGRAAERMSGRRPLPPRRRSGVVVGSIVALVIVLGAGAVLAAGAGDDDPRKADQVASDDAGEAATTQTTTTTIRPVTAPEAFGLAARRLTGAGTFSYSGTVSATDVSQARPMLWLAVESTVQGQVATATARVHEVAVAADGQTVETVTDGPRVWGRRAAAVDVLPEEPYEAIPGLSQGAPPAKGLAQLPAWLRAATGATDAGVDDLGRRTFQATIPADVLGVIERDRSPVDAAVVLSVDEAGDPARVVLTSAADGPAFHLAIDLTGLGAPVVIEPPPTS